MILAAGDDGCVREVRDPGRRPVDPGLRERPTDQEAEADEHARPLRRPRLGLPRRCSTCGSTSRPSSGRGRRAPSAGCAAPSSSTTCGCASGRTWSASCARSANDLGLRRNRRAGVAPTQIHRAAAGRAAVARRHVRPRRPATTWAPARPASRSPAARCCNRKSPAWVMAGELVETNRLWARMVARIDPSWIEPAAEHLVKRTLRRAVVGRPPGLGDDRRAGHALRAAGRRGPPGAARARRPRARPRRCSSTTPWSTATGARQHAFVAANRALVDEAAGPGGPRPPPRPARHPGPAGATSTTSGSPTTWSRPATSTAGGRTPGAPSPTC